MSSVYMQLQNTEQNSVLTGYSNILFNETLAHSDEEQIRYDTTTGIITIYKLGAYYLDWFLVSQQSASPVVLLLAVTSEGGRFVPANTALKRDEVTGSAVINVDEPGVQIALTNGTGDLVLGDVPVVANLVIHSLDMESVVSPSNPNLECDGGSIINFQSGVVDCPVCNPFSWPILLDVLQISWMQEQCNYLKKVCTPSGIEDLLGFPKGILSHVSVKSHCEPIFIDLLKILDDLTEPFDMFSRVVSDAGLFSTDVYLNHADISVVPAISTGDLPFFGLDGPLTPLIIAKDGFITSFAAEYDGVVAFDSSLFNTIPGIIITINQLFNLFASTIDTLIRTLSSISSILIGLGAPLPSLYADTLNNLIMKRLLAQTSDFNHHVHAVLWKRADHYNEDTEWEKVTDIDLGPVPWLELAPLDTFVSSIGDIIAAGGNVLSTLLTLLGSRGTLNHSPTNVPFRAAMDTHIHHPISAGDYLIVQFTLVGSDNTTVLAGVIATNIMASVAIDCE
jgi:hypothetical protein